MINRIHSTFFQRKIREEIEWTNYWLDNRYNNIQKHILLIGDSTSREIRSTLARISETPVDFIGSSSHVLDELLLNQIEFFFEMSDFEYKMIHIQLGCHGILSLPNDIDLEQFYLDYKEQYRRLILFLKTKSPKIVLGSATQIVKYPDMKNSILNKIYNHIHSAKSEIPDMRYEIGIVQRNKIVKELCEEEHVQFDDLYSYMLSEGRKIRHIDHVHYEKNARILLANRVMTFI